MNASCLWWCDAKPEEVPLLDTDTQALIESLALPAIRWPDPPDIEAELMAAMLLASPSVARRIAASVAELVNHAATYHESPRRAGRDGHPLGPTRSRGRLRRAARPVRPPAGGGPINRLLTRLRDNYADLSTAYDDIINRCADGNREPNEHEQANLIQLRTDMGPLADRIVELTRRRGPQNRCA